MPHGKPDFANAEFVLFVGTAPGQAGNPFKRQGTLIAKARTEGKLTYVVVDPVLTHAGSRAAATAGDGCRSAPAPTARWRWPSCAGCSRTIGSTAVSSASRDAALAKENGEPSFSNATHLVVVEPKHPREGGCCAHRTWAAMAEEQRYKEADAFVCLDGAGKPVFHDQAKGPAQLFVDTMLQGGRQGSAGQVFAAIAQGRAMRLDLAAYAEACGIDAATLAALARELSSHGKRASVIAHGGMMSGSGFYNAYALMSINALLGNINWKGGLVANGGGFKPDGEGPRYNLDDLPGHGQAGGTPTGPQRAL